ncbi:PH domain-containing protein [Chryseobacterium sp. R2A-55]|uniref:PH domain-containing protein n=1 Tax=Chryseobacterium sp. R2A-55 TaxID=2744445 RepID=UPI001F3E2976|nr:PH domain-containing protein [Chryseobacterium sp. R2A-55]
MKEFPTAKMDKIMLMMTFFFGGICIAVIFTAVYQIWIGEYFTIFPGILVLAALITSYLLIPKISVNQGEIRVKNSFVDFPIRFSEVAEITRIEKLRFVIRTFGVGGLFGNFGYFNGNDVWYVTNRRKKVQIKMKSGKVYMLSPENPDEFINYIQTQTDFPGN